MFSARFSLRRERRAGILRYVSIPANIEEVLSNRYVFHCRQAGVRMRDDERAAVDVAVGHLVTLPYAHQVEWAPPSLQSVYAHSDGAALFCPDGTRIDNIGADYGFILHAVDDVSGATDGMRGWLLADLESERDEFDPAEFDAAHRRINSFVEIGSKCSGDPVVLDRSASVGSEDVPVLLLDHELLLAAVLGDSGDMLSVHHDVVAFLMAVHLDPLAYLEDSWRYHGPDGRQYFVESIEHAA